MEWLRYFTIENQSNGILINGWKQGIHQEFDTYDYIHICTYLDNLLHGDEWVYSADILKTHNYYVNGMRQGVQYDYYYDSDVVAMKSIYNLNKLHGTYTLYSFNGDLLEEKHYAYGKLDGTKKRWDDHGNIKCEEQYLNGKLHGEQKYLGNNMQYYTDKYTYGINTHILNEYISNMRDAGCKLNMKTLKLERQKSW